ncbi:MAG TPA: hypothetical protein VI756_25790 [Blastocatellia bacterium]
MSSQGPQYCSKGVITIAGREFVLSLPLTEQPGSIKRVRVQHEDGKSSRAELLVRDVDNVTNQPFPIFNGMPSPSTNPTDPYEVTIGWEDGPQYSVFGGLFQAKKVNAFPHHTMLVGLHDSHKMKRVGEVKHATGISRTQFWNQLAAEYNLTIRLQPQLAGESFMTDPIDWQSQGHPGEQSNWQVLKAECDRFGLIMCTPTQGIVDIREDKSDLPTFTLTWGVDRFIEFECLDEVKRQKKSGKRLGHAEEHIKGLQSHHKTGTSQDGTQNLETTPPHTPKKQSGNVAYKDPFRQSTMTRMATRLGEVEGLALRIGIPLRPDINNFHQLNLQEAGAQLSGTWQLASCEHSIEHNADITRFTAWRKPGS